MDCHVSSPGQILIICYIFQELSSQNMYDAGVALNGLSCFITRTSLNHLLYFSGLE